MTGQREKNIKKSVFQRYSAVPYIIWAFFFIIVPLVFVAYYAFSDSTGAFSLSNITMFFTDYMPTFLKSLKLASIATLICLILGYPCAYFISKATPKTQKVLLLLVMLPMWMNLLLRTYSLMTIIRDTGLINSFLAVFGIPPVHIFGTEGAVVLGMIYDFLPFMILPIYNVMAKLDNRLIEAAADLGCNNLTVIRKIILPLTKSGVISGVTMVFVPCISTFYISQKLSGGKVYLIGDAIESLYNQYNYNAVAALSFVLMIILIVGLAVVNKFSDGNEGGRRI